MNKPISRRDFLKLAGGAAVTVTGASLLPQFLRKHLMPEQVVGAAGDYDLYLAARMDGSVYRPETLSTVPIIPIAMLQNIYPAKHLPPISSVFAI